VQPARPAASGDPVGAQQPSRLPLAHLAGVPGIDDQGDEAQGEGLELTLRIPLPIDGTGTTPGGACPLLQALDSRAREQAQLGGAPTGSATWATRSPCAVCW
jgi:hypothetical protein